MIFTDASEASARSIAATSCSRARPLRFATLAPNLFPQSNEIRSDGTELLSQCKTELDPVTTASYIPLNARSRERNKMVASKFVAYYRVSTARQGRSGLGLDAQREAVRAHVTSGGTVLAEYQDIESGKNDDRPALRKALDHCRMTGARLLIAKLDRLSRSVAFIAQLMGSGVKFTACDMPDANELTIHIVAAVAQAERKAIGERTRAALKAAKARGVKLGNPANLRNRRAGSKAGNAIKARIANDAAELAMVQIRDAQQRGAATLREIATDLNDRGFRTPRGAMWQAVQVQRAMTRVL